MTLHAPPVPLTGSYDPRLVLLSVVVAALASYVALVLAARLTTARGTLRVTWLLGGAVAMGTGIWSMHFVGMLAFRLGRRPIIYDILHLGLSLAVAIGASALALLVVSRARVTRTSLAAASLLMGAAIAGMHYLGMAGLHTTAALRFTPSLVVASVAIAVLASGAALSLSTRLRSDETRRGEWRRGAAAVVMGLAIAGMHYTAMAAARFFVDPSYATALLRDDAVVATSGLAAAVAVTALLPLGLAVAGSITNRYLSAIAAREAQARHAAAALEVTEARYRSLVEAVAEIIWVTNPAGEFDRPQPGWSMFTGQSFETLRGVGWLDAVHPDDRAATLRAWRYAIATGTSYETEHRIRRYDNAYIPMAVRAVPVRDQQGVIREWVGVHEDVRERHDAEANLRRMEAQLLQAQKLEAVGRLAGGIAHDFNNILTVITGTSEIALRTERTDEVVNQDLETIRSAAERATVLTRQLLAFSRRQMLQPEIVDLNGVVRRVDALLRRLIGEDVALNTVLGADLGPVHADAGQLEQVLMNLAVNARDAMPTGGVLTIETQNAELARDYAGQHLGVESGPYVMLAVSDTGHGMDALTRAQIFEPFFTTKEPGKGTGLGLATVYGIVKQSGGSIFVYSEPGHGATFKIYLPRIAVAGRAVMPPALTGFGGGREVVLLAEDARDVRVFIARVLRDVGYEVLEADDVETALVRAREFPRPIPLVITDVVMPGGSGRDLATILRRERPEITVLFMSGYTDDAVAQRGVLEPGTAFIQKPFSPALLTQRIREVLDAGSRDGRATPAAG